MVGERIEGGESVPGGGECQARGRGETLEGDQGNGGRGRGGLRRWGLSAPHSPISFEATTPFPSPPLLLSNLGGSGGGRDASYSQPHCSGQWLGDREGHTSDKGGKGVSAAPGSVRISGTLLLWGLFCPRPPMHEPGPHTSTDTTDRTRC